MVAETLDRFTGGGGDEVYTAGVDEAGRGPLAGPVVAAAVILGSDHGIPGIRDSKKLSVRAREAAECLIKEHAVAWAVSFVAAAHIDRVNILQATLLAMSRAVGDLRPSPGLALIDGNQCPSLDVPARAEVRGDARFACIAAASIVAKVARDRYMCDLDERFPGYGFASHKGYGTRAHLQALKRLGVTPEHRLSFAPVRTAAVCHGQVIEP